MDGMGIKEPGPGVQALPNFQHLVWVPAQYPFNTFGNFYWCGIKVQSILSLDLKLKGRDKRKSLKLKSYYLPFTYLSTSPPSMTNVSQLIMHGDIWWFNVHGIWGLASFCTHSSTWSAQGVRFSITLSCIKIAFTKCHRYLVRCHNQLINQFPTKMQSYTSLTKT